MVTSEKAGDKAPKNLAQTPEINKIKLADGKEYELIPVDINVMADLEAKFDDTPFLELLSSGRAKPLRHLIYLRLKPNYPELTEEQVGKQVSMKVLADILATIGME